MSFDDFIRVLRTESSTTSEDLLEGVLRDRCSTKWAVKQLRICRMCLLVHHLLSKTLRAGHAKACAPGEPCVVQARTSPRAGAPAQ